MSAQFVWELAHLIENALDAADEAQSLTSRPVLKAHFIAGRIATAFQPVTWHEAGRLAAREGQTVYAFRPESGNEQKEPRA